MSLPSDILILVLQNLSIQELAALCCTCRAVYALVNDCGWSLYLRANTRPSYSLSNALAHWSPRTCAQYNALTDAAWVRSEFIARPLSRPWIGKLQPTLTINPSRLVVAAGNTLYSYRFADFCKEKQSPPIISEGSYIFTPPYSVRNRDITAVTFVDDGNSDRTLFIGFRDGSLERATITQPSADGEHHFGLSRYPVGIPDVPGDFIESLSSSKEFLLSLTASGRATLSMTTAPTSSSIELNSRSWASYLCFNAVNPFAAFGMSSTMPLAVYSIKEDGFNDYPTAILQPQSASGHQPFSAVYGISQAPAASPWGCSPQILVSGWFDGCVRCYDLRSSSRSRDLDQRLCGPAPLQPVLSLSDPWSYESIYSVSCGGGFSTYIAAGSARHSVVSFWDVRSPKTGWSVHAPGNDPSPVYSVILESSRLFGATQSRPFVYDFGPGVTFNTYPNLPRARGIDGLRVKKGQRDPGFYVTTYRHSTSNDY
ncbi:hypothetical protein AX17_006293 [Amanita inopinata Kibby_2008]|nr:hypothetical protein AX17_006293 [Amanita inopinata Kibby_2008]